MRTILFFIFLSIVVFDISSQKVVKWDDTLSEQRPEQCKEVEIVSSADGKVQKAFFYRNQSGESRPLIVSLHT